MPNLNEKPAIFLDRDGVLNRYLPGDYVRRPSDLHLLPGSADVVRRFNIAGFPVFVISNQQGVAKGLMSSDDLQSVDDALKSGLRAHEAFVDTIYYCTHHANDRCDCRKPLPGLLLRASEEHTIDLRRSIMVGDTETDSQAARAVHIGAFVLVLSGKFADAKIAKDRHLFPIPPDFVAADLAAASDTILQWLGSQPSGTEPTG